MMASLFFSICTATYLYQKHFFDFSEDSTFKKTILKRRYSKPEVSTKERPQFCRSTSFDQENFVNHPKNSILKNSILKSKNIKDNQERTEKPIFLRTRSFSQEPYIDSYEKLNDAEEDHKINSFDLSANEKKNSFLPRLISRNHVKAKNLPNINSSFNVNLFEKKLNNDAYKQTINDNNDHKIAPAFKLPLKKSFYIEESSESSFLINEKHHQSFNSQNIKDQSSDIFNQQELNDHSDAGNEKDETYNCSPIENLINKLNIKINRKPIFDDRTQDMDNQKFLNKNKYKLNAKKIQIYNSNHKDWEQENEEAKNVNNNKIKINKPRTLLRRNSTNSYNQNICSEASQLTTV